AGRILGPDGVGVHAPAAALANGTLAHAFEMDNLTWPSTGVHPGATLLPAALAVAQERGQGGSELITAIVAGAEVMIRIGRATQHNNESRGFHAPGTTGPFGAAVAAADWWALMPSACQKRWASAARSPSDWWNLHGRKTAAWCSGFIF